RQRRLDGIAHIDPGALGTRNRAADQNQAALCVGRNDLEVLGRHAGSTHVTGHLLALEHLTRVLALTSRTVRAVRNRVTVGCTATTEVVALHDTLETLTDRGTRHVDLLANDEVIGSDLGANLDEVFRRDAEFRDLRLRLDRG